MHKRKIPLSIFFISAVVLAVILTSIISLIFVRNRLDQVNIDAVDQSNDEVAKLVKYKLQSTLSEQIGIVKGVEVAHHGLIGSAGAFDEEYYELIVDQNQYLVSLEILDIDRVVLYSSRDIENRVGTSLVGYDLVDSVTEIHQQRVGGLVYDTSNESLTLEILYSGEDVLVLGRISVDYLSDFGDRFNESFNDKKMMILASTGLFIYDSVNQDHLIQKRYDAFEDLLSDAEEDLYIRDINGVPSVFSVVETSENWTIVIYEDVESSLELSRINMTYFTIAIIAMMVIMSVIFLMYDFVVVRSINLLSKSFDRAKEKDFEPIEKLTMFKELDALKTSYNDMVHELDFYVNKLRNIAYIDLLTNLPTKQKAMEDFRKHSDSYTKRTHFLYMDIVRFSIINNNYGYDVGDESLKQIANILKDELELVYRIEGDEFLAVVDLSTVEELEFKIEDLETSLYEHVSILGNKYNFKLKFGLSTYQKDGVDFNELFKKAVIASESVKKKMTGNYEFYDDLKTEFYERTSKIEFIIGDALDHQEFYTCYQPIIDAKTSDIRGFEALSRWSNKELGNIRPDEFIPILERTKRVHKLDTYVLHNAIRLCRFLEEEYGVRLVASVNISVETIMRDSFEETIKEALQKFKMDPSLLELEITESTIITDFDKITKKMSNLRDLGVKFSEDDFGDRYSSLTYLSRLKIDTLKISKSFLSSILSNVESRVLVQTILGLSKRLGFYTIVEGVEDVKIFDLFKKFGCDYVQGYYFYKPMAEEDMIDLFKDQRSVSR